MAGLLARIGARLGLAPRPSPGRGRAVVARYDAAIPDDQTRRHWANADPFSARAANDPLTRYRLRTRARYEIANNSYAKGIVETLANDTIGTGPRLQLQTGDAAADREIERAFADWSCACGLADKLRVMRKARAGDGEAFGFLVANPSLPTDVKLDLRLIEADQVATPALDPFNPLAVDGIEFDRAGNPVQYHLLPEHPGDFRTFQSFLTYQRVPARLVVHWFRADRPGQFRGVPDITPALPLFAQLRRFTLATLTAAETAANMGAAVLQTTMPPEGDVAEGTPFETLEISRGMLTTLPAGYTMAQLRAEHPATTYEMFKREVLNEIARCLNMPFNVAAGNSSSYNYSSGRLDHQVYYKSLRVDQSEVERVVLDRVLAAWLQEAALATGLVPGRFASLADWPHQWFWDGAEHVDPLKEADAQATRLASRTTTYAREFARQGRDWEAEFAQIAREREVMAALGIDPPAPPSAAGAPPARRAGPTPPPTDGGGNDAPDD